jgi:exodeoxyribonuclease-3
LKLGTWNVNSLKVRLVQLLDWLAREKPDIVCLQETKLEDEKFPRQELIDAGYHAVFSGQKTYNGVAILSRSQPESVSRGIAGYVDQQQRVITATLGDLRVVNAYVPNGQSVTSDKYQYKLGWLAAFSAMLKQELASHPRLAVLGDFNVAPEDLDVHDPKFWEGQVLFSLPERAAFRELLQVGLKDALRIVDPGGRAYSWWDYRLNAFKRGMGLRIDHVLLSGPLAERCRSVRIDRDMRALERPSDHAPVIAELDS